ncbi:MAG: hypothetical protein EA425_07190 [Puniceicoccaceae bacterium]|nr:MAG: hypothetical protein EA425_07190 [Puniceicoccaceae bacterium]
MTATDLLDTVLDRLLLDEDLYASFRREAGLDPEETAAEVVPFPAEAPATEPELPLRQVV